MPTAFGFRAHTNRNIPRSGHPVCVTAIYNPAGDFRPVAFGAEMDGMRYRFKFSSAALFKESRDEYVFDCEYVDMGRIKAVRLVFDVTGCRWIIG